MASQQNAMIGIFSVAIGAILLYSGIKNKSPIGIAKSIAAGEFDFSKVGAVTIAATSSTSITSSSSQSVAV